MDVVVLIDEGERLFERNPRGSLCRTTTVVRLLDVVRSERDSYSVRYLTATDRPCGLRRHVITRPRAARSRKALYDRRRRKLRGGHLEPLPEQRVFLGRQHPLRRLAQTDDARRQGGLRRRRHHARRFRAGRHDRRDGNTSSRWRGATSSTARSSTPTVTARGAQRREDDSPNCRPCSRRRPGSVETSSAMRRVRGVARNYRDIARSRN